MKLRERERERERESTRMVKPCSRSERETVATCKGEDLVGIDL